MRNLYPYRVRTLSLEEMPGYPREPACVPLMHQLRYHPESSVPLPHRPISSNTVPASSPVKSDPNKPTQSPDLFFPSSQTWRDTTSVSNGHAILTSPIISEQPQSDVPSTTPSTQPAPITQDKYYYSDHVSAPSISPPAPQKLAQTQTQPRSTVHELIQRYTAISPRRRTPLGGLPHPRSLPRRFPGYVIRSLRVESSTSKGDDRMTAEHGENRKRNWRGLMDESFTLDGKGRLIAK
ncbi:hypothetical protein GJ744_000274 [Endocarpon pusillum]|uniref:Uncharacterized protein n=1 Tax=Endocarpon pusillum TaxID=364733 RepID=A0A8H7ATK6_9EURO|nr:hypothetical protein GJ744_000274 [Endocarpon pusillum]